MDNLLSGIEKNNGWLVIGIIAIFGLMEVLSGQLKRAPKTTGDWIQEAGGFLVLTVLIKPLIVLVVFATGNLLTPSLNNALAHVSFWILFPLYILADDMLQYWYHRSAHEYDFLWKLHRPHH